MRIDAIRVIAKREYLARVKSKGFWIATLLLPVLLASMIVLPSLFLAKAGGEQHIAVVDQTGKIAASLKEELTAPKKGEPEETAAKKLGTSKPSQDLGTRYEIESRAPAADPTAQRAGLDAEVLAKSIDAWIWISREGLEKDEVEYHGENISNFVTQEQLASALSKVAGRVRLAEAGMDVERVQKLTHSIEVQTIRISKAGSREEAGFAGFILAYFLFFLLYTVVAVYGGQVMNGVLEEKTSRIVEILVAGVRPFDLMMGKLLGIGAVGLTQLTIWLGTTTVLASPGVVPAIAIFGRGKMPEIPIGLLVHFVFLFMLGFFLFASLYAAIGAATNNAQEAQQLSGMVVPFLVAPAILMVAVINAPDSTLSVVLSLIPPFTPLLMLLRMAVKMPPTWQIALGYVLTTAFIVGLVWACGRIYRVGILMYGKRPTFQEMWRWLRYS